MRRELLVSHVVGPCKAGLWLPELYVLGSKGFDLARGIDNASSCRARADVYADVVSLQCGKQDIHREVLLI